MTLDKTLHKTILFQILKDIYSDTNVSPYLGFKGGTAAMMYHGLDRFSVDLDFDLLDDSNEKEVFEKVVEIVQRHGKLKDSHMKQHNLFCLLSYEDRAHNIKIEINKIQFGSRYEVKTYLGVSMLVMVPEDMFAHKLMAMYERIGKTSRDIYDVWFFLENRFPINQDIVEQRAGMPFDKVIDECVNKLEKLSARKILDGVGELLSEGRKDWARAKLREETISLLLLRKTGRKGN